jgi:pyruvate dehydrogenase E2 component (dihydrolipoamide acetyltransferase)
MSYQITIPEGAPEGAEVLEIFVNVGDEISEGTMVLEIEGDKANFPVESEKAGKITQINVKVGDKVSSGAVVMLVEAASSPSKGGESVEPAASSPVTAIAPSNPVAIATSPTLEGSGEASASFRSSPVAKEIAHSFGIDVNSVKPSHGTRISKEDVIAHVKAQQAAAIAAVPAAKGGGGMAQKALPDFSKFGPIRRAEMTKIGVATAENMNYAWSTIPHAWIQEKADITAIEAFRQTYKERVKAAGGSLTMTSILTKVIAAALRKFPSFNCSVDMDKKEIIHKDYVHIAIAVDTDRGLLVPVIRDADRKGLIEISVELTQLSARTRDNKNTATDMQGGTFTISNIGGIGCSAIMPIVASPQVAILGVTAAQEEARLINGVWTPRLIMPMTIGFDHRVINGADTARFLKYVKEMLEDPMLMQLY